MGHLRLFKQCKQHADYLIVAVQNGDYIKKFKPETEVFYSTDERVEMLEAIRIIDEVVVYDEIGIDALSRIDFDVLALGEDHLGERFDIIQEWCKKNKKQVVRLKRTQGVSSSEIKCAVKRLKG